MNKWRKLLAEYVEMYGPEQAAEKLVLEMHQSPDEEFDDWLVRLVRTEAKWIDRARTRRVEREVFGEGHNPTAEDRIRLANESFTLPTGERVLWLEATVEQHQARIEFQRSFIAKVEDDIDRHIAAIELIESFGANCLADLEGVTV